MSMAISDDNQFATLQTNDATWHNILTFAGTDDHLAVGEIRVLGMCRDTGECFTAVQPLALKWYDGEWCVLGLDLPALELSHNEFGALSGVAMRVVIDGANLEVDVKGKNGRTIDWGVVLDRAAYLTPG